MVVTHLKYLKIAHGYFINILCFVIFVSLACHSDNDFQSSGVDEMWKNILNCFEITLSKDLLAM